MTLPTITPALMRAIAPYARAAIVEPGAPEFDKQMPPADIATPLRAAHFLAQCAHESDGFKTLEEYASGRAYEGAKRLGNTQTGDGKRYKGRGFIQLTGRANYRAAGMRLKHNLEEEPKLALVPAIAVATAIDYWLTRGLNHLADADDLTRITRRINGGLNGFESRQLYLARAKKAFGL